MFVQKDIAKRQKEYLKILNNGEALKGNEICEENKEPDPIMKGEFNKTLKNVKNKKAAGNDGIQELQKEAGEKVKNGFIMEN